MAVLDDGSADDEEEEEYEDDAESEYYTPKSSASPVDSSFESGHVDLVRKAEGAEEPQTCSPVSTDEDFFSLSSDNGEELSVPATPAASIVNEEPTGAAIMDTTRVGATKDLLDHAAEYINCSACQVNLIKDFRGSLRYAQKMLKAHWKGLVTLSAKRE